MSTSYEDKYEDAYIKDWKQNEEERITDDKHAPGPNPWGPNKWDFDPKFRHGSITEETPDEKRRREFYMSNRGAIENMTSSIMHLRSDKYSASNCIDYAALIISEISKRAGFDRYLKPGDPEFDDASCIDEL
jgi:hypothetical protein